MSTDKPRLGLGNLTWHYASVTRQDRERDCGHRGSIIWFTGLSGSGKSTLANAVEYELHRRGCRTFVLDGDNIRHGLCSDLGFSIEERAENLRRVGEVAKLFVEAGVIVLSAFISPLRKERERVRARVPHGDFLEVYCAASLSICEKRDPKGLYRRARKGLIPDFTGITSPYEAPEAPDLYLETGESDVSDCVAEVLSMIEKRGILIPV